MYEITVDYEGAYKYRAASRDCIVSVSLPKEGMSADGITPPDLLLASIGSCLAVYLERYLTGAAIPFHTFSIHVTSEICKESPHYLKNIDSRIEIQGASLDEKRKKALLDFVRNCPVHNTLIHNPTVSIALTSD